METLEEYDMASAANLTTITPLIPAGPSLPDALQFYSRELGFDITWQADSMAGIRRGNVELNLVENSTRDWADNASFSIGVDDLDALYQEYRGIKARVGPLAKELGTTGVSYDPAVRRLFPVLPDAGLDPAAWPAGKEWVHKDDGALRRHQRLFV